MALELFGYQVESRNFLLEGGSLCADDPGCGKTLVSLDALRCIHSPNRSSLVVCPAVALGVWEREAEQHGFTTQIVRRVRDLDRPADIYVCTVDMLRNSRLLAALMLGHWEVLLVDEAHYGKNPVAARTRSLMALAEETRAQDGVVWLLTGTPTPNHIGELWTLITMTAPERIGHMSYKEFTERYCRWKLQRIPKRDPVRVIAGNNRISVPVLMDDLKGWWIRHRKQDVLPQLPPKLRRVVPLHGCDLTLVDEMLETPEGRAVANAIRSGDFTSIGPDDDLHLARMSRLLAMAKVDQVVAYARGMLENHPKMIIWGWHTEPLREIARRLGQHVETVYGDGSSSKKDRDFIEYRMQKVARPFVPCLQLKAFGTAITLTEADRAIFTECRTTPGDMIQAEDRIHRIGQTGDALIDLVAVRNSIDEAFMAIVQKRLREWDQVEALQ